MVLRTFRARKPVVKLPVLKRWSFKQVFNVRKNQEDCEVLWLRTTALRTYKGNCSTRNRPGKFRNVWETGPSFEILQGLLPYENGISLLTLSPARIRNDSITWSAVSVSAVSLVMKSRNAWNVTNPVLFGSTIAMIRANSSSPWKKKDLTKSILFLTEIPMAMTEQSTSIKFHTRVENRFKREIYCLTGWIPHKHLDIHQV